MKKENNNTLPITDLVKDTMNFNKHKRMDLLNKSLEKFGAGRSILIDKNNHIIAGNGLVETAEKLDYKDIVVVESDGTKIIAVKRTDIDLNTKVGRELALADNQTAHLNLEWDYENLNMAVEDFAIDLNEFEIPVEEVADYSDKNKEIDTNEFSEKMTLKLELSQDEFSFVNNELSKIDANKELALLKLLNYES